MKARVIKTGEMVDVYHEPQHGQVTNIYKESILVNGRMWSEDELDFCKKTNEASQQYIPKSSLVAEIEKIIDEIYKGQPFDSLSREKQVALWYIKSIMSSVNSLEVKEVDLEKEVDNYIYSNLSRPRMALELDWKQCDISFKAENLIKFAEHFFELGLKAQKKEKV